MTGIDIIGLKTKSMTDNSELTKEYIELAKFYSSAASFDLANTKKINKAANRMIEIAEL